jgi:hypothetical protein
MRFEVSQSATPTPGAGHEVPNRGLALEHLILNSEDPCGAPQVTREAARR